MFGPWSGAGGGGPSNIIREAMRNALAGKEAIVPPGAMEWVYSKDAARGTVMALDAKDLGSRVFNITMGAMTTPAEMAEAIQAVVPGAKVKFEAPAGTGVSLSNRDSHADLSRAKRHLGFEPEFQSAGCGEGSRRVDAASSGDEDRIEAGRPVFTLSWIWGGRRRDYHPAAGEFHKSKKVQREATSMSKSKVFIAAALALGVSSSVTAQQPAPPPLPQAPNMSFFVTGKAPARAPISAASRAPTSTARRWRQRHGAGGKTWRAYLSTQPADGKPAVNARDRIGNGPWQNFKGTVVAANLDELHSDNNKLGFDNSLSERGLIIPGVGFAPNRHDVLTGSTMRRPRVPGRRRSHLPQLDQQHPGRGDGRPYRQEGPARRPAVEVVEFVASLARAGGRMQPERSARHGWRWVVLLLRQQLATATEHMRSGLG